MSLEYTVLMLRSSGELLNMDTGVGMAITFAGGSFLYISEQLPWSNYQPGMFLLPEKSRE